MILIIDMCTQMYNVHEKTFVRNEQKHFTAKSKLSRMYGFLPLLNYQTVETLSLNKNHTSILINHL